MELGLVTWLLGFLGKFPFQNCSFPHVTFQLTSQARGSREEGGEKREGKGGGGGTRAEGGGGGEGTARSR